MGVSSDILLSVVIPTKNRAGYLLPALACMLEIPSSRFELIISDNSDDDYLERHFAAAPTNPRVHYIRVRQPISMTENCNKAVAEARGTFVCLIGDDDIILPNLIQACESAQTQGWDAVTPGMNLRYYWPDLRHRFWGRRQAGRIYLNPWQGRMMDTSPAEQARSCVKRAGQGMEWMVNLYHGAVRRSLLETLKKRTGAYFHGVSPDVYSSLALSMIAGRQVRYMGPLTIPGSSGKSNSGRAAMNAHQGDLWEDPHMKPYRGQTWPAAVPAFFAVETVWAQAALTACKQLGRTDLERAFNYSRLYALCLLRHRRRLTAVVQAARALHEGPVPLWRWLCIGSAMLVELARVGGYFLHRAMRPTPRGFAREYGPYETIHSAFSSMDQVLPGQLRAFPSAFSEHERG